MIITKIEKILIIIGVLIYVANNTISDTIDAVHEYARFKHCIDSHTTAVNMISRYLKGTRYKGIILNPIDTM